MRREVGRGEPAPALQHAAFELGMAAHVDLARLFADEYIAFVATNLYAVERQELDLATKHLRAGIGDDPGLLEQFAPRRLLIALARIDRAARRAPEGRAAVGGGESEQQDAAVIVDQQDACGGARGAGHLDLASRGREP